jgi:hypothetical protein
MNQSQPQSANIEQIKFLESELEIKESLQINLEVAAGEFETWYREQKRNVLGSLTQHIDGQLELAEADLLESKKKIQIEIPSKETRVILRKRFHMRVIRALRFNFWGAFSLLILPMFFDFLDKAKYFSPIGPAIYPIIAAAVFSSILIFVIVRVVITGRIRRKFQQIKDEVKADLSTNELESETPLFEATQAEPKEKRLKKWPFRRVFFWISSAFTLCALIFFWPVAGIFAKIAIKSPFFPSAWQILLTAFVLFFIRFLLALLEYQKKFYAHYVEVQKVYEAVEWFTTGSVSAQVAIRKFNFLKMQLAYWNRILGKNFKRPWSADHLETAAENEFMLGQAFPISVRIAEVIDETSDLEARTALRTLQNKVYQKITSPGWRQQNFKEHYSDEAFLARYSPRANEIATALDRINIGTSKVLSQEFEQLIDNPDFLKLVAQDILDRESGEFQKQILDTGNLKVKISRPYIIAKNKVEWDEHLKSILLDSSSASALPNEYMQRWPFTSEAISAQGFDGKVATFVSGSQRIIEWVEQQQRNVVTSQSEQQKDRKIDLVLRVDLVGVRDSALTVEDIKIPTLISNTDVEYNECSTCFSFDCAAVSDPTAKCTGGDYFEVQ